MVDNGLVVLVGAMGEVHANYIETNFTEGVDLLSGVCLGADGTDDGGSPVLLCRCVLSVELAEPLDPGPAGVEVV
jgi:hypothetical protein